MPRAQHDAQKHIREQNAAFYGAILCNTAVPSSLSGLQVSVRYGVGLGLPRPGLVHIRDSAACPGRSTRRRQPSFPTTAARTPAQPLHAGLQNVVLRLPAPVLTYIHVVESGLKNAGDCLEGWGKDRTGRVEKQKSNADGPRHRSCS